MILVDLIYGILSLGIKGFKLWTNIIRFIHQYLFGIVTPDGKSCNATQSPDFTATAFVAAHSLLQVVIPYLFPYSIWFIDFHR